MSKRTSPSADMTDDEARDMGLPESEWDLLRMISTGIVQTGVDSEENFKKAWAAVLAARRDRAARGD